MKYLLDTHALIWAYAAPERLSDDVRATVGAEGVTVYASHVSLWEMAIKRRIGKMPGLTMPAVTWFESVVPRMNLRSLAILPAHLGMLEDLPLHHGDPFDRLLVAQAINEAMTFVTCDPKIDPYDVATLW